MLVGPCGATGPDGQPMPGVLVDVDPCRQRYGARRCAGMDTWRRSSPRPCRDREARRRGAGELARWGFPLPPRGMSRSTSGGPCPLGFPTKSLW